MCEESTNKAGAESDRNIGSAIRLMARQTWMSLDTLQFPDTRSERCKLFRTWGLES